MWHYDRMTVSPSLYSFLSSQPIQHFEISVFGGCSRDKEATRAFKTSLVGPCLAITEASPIFSRPLWAIKCVFCWFFHCFWVDLFYSWINEAAKVSKTLNNWVFSQKSLKITVIIIRTISFIPFNQGFLSKSWNCTKQFNLLMLYIQWKSMKNATKQW